jgi:hypothetical protein
LRKPVKLEAEWNLSPDEPYQFKTELVYEKGKQGGKKQGGNNAGSRILRKILRMPAN